MIPSTLSAFLLSLGGIIIVDLILSGDNALVIGAAASHIRQPRRRWIALSIGGLGAIVLRILFTTSATFLLAIPYLQAGGGLLVLIIAIRLLLDDQSSENPGGDDQSATPTRANEQLPALAKKISDWMSRKIGDRVTSETWVFLKAIITITIADISMSLDNIVAIGALAHRQVVSLIIGLSLSIALLLLGSALVSLLISRVPWLIMVASFILAWISADLIWNGIHSWSFIEDSGSIHFSLYAILILIVSFVALVTRHKRFSAYFHFLARLASRTR